MKLRELQQELKLQVLNEADFDKEITGGYTGDLLSWVMSKAQSGNIWVTIMTNKNVLAVASFTDVSGVIIAECAEIPKELADEAKKLEINLFASPLSAFALCGATGKLLS